MYYDFLTNKHQSICMNINNNLHHFKSLLEAERYDELYNQIKDINNIDQILDGIANKTNNKNGK